MGTRSRGGYQDPANRALAAEVRARGWPRPPRVLVVRRCRRRKGGPRP